MTVEVWKKVSETKVVTHTKFKEFTKDSWINPKTGKTEDYYYLGLKGGKTPSIIFPITINNEVIAIKQFRHGAEEVIIETPGGNPEKSAETARDVAQKELMQETGYRAGQIINLGRKWFEPCSYKIGFHAILAKDCVRVSEQKLDESELIEIALVPVDKWVQMIDSGIITDSKTITVTFLGLLRIGFLHQ